MGDLNLDFERLGAIDHKKSLNVAGLFVFYYLVWWSQALIGAQLDPLMS